MERFFAQPQQQYLQVSSRGTLRFYNNFGGMDVYFSAALKTRWTPCLRLWETLTSEWCVDYLVFVSAVLVKHLRLLCLPYLQKQVNKHGDTVRWPTCSTGASLFFHALCRLVKELPPAAGAESLCSAPLTDLTKQLRDISVFYCSHEKYPLIVRLCPSRNSVSCTASCSSSSQLCTRLALLKWGVWLVPRKICWHPVVSFTNKKIKKKHVLTISLLNKTTKIWFLLKQQSINRISHTATIIMENMELFCVCSSAKRSSGDSIQLFRRFSFSSVPRPWGVTLNPFLFLISCAPWPLK